MGKDLIVSMAQVSGTGDPYEHLFYVLDNKEGGVGLVTGVPEFSWFREKSNETVKDPRRRFSFYYARLVYLDEFHLEKPDSAHSSEGDERWKIIGHPFMLERSDILMVIETSKIFIPGKKHILSAMVLSDRELLDAYNENKFKILSSVQKDNFNELRRQESMQNKRNIDYLRKLTEKTF